MSETIVTPEESNRLANPAARPEARVRFSKTPYLDEQHGREMEVFRLSLGDESILLLPLKNWMQLDIHKWVPRGRLPSSPPGLEITGDHVKLAGETVSIQDPDGCGKLEKVFGEWLALEQETIELARKRVVPKPAVAVQETAPAAPQRMRFQVEVDKTGQVHIRCVQGKEVLAAIGLNQSGFKSLFGQSLMRKPHVLQVGALHDWVELDGLFFSFEKGNNDSAKLEAALNERYLPAINPGEGMDIVFYANPASPTGFDIQFPVTMAGVRENKRRPLNDESLELLQDPVRCGLLHKNIVIKLTRPNLVFKLKKSDGGEGYLDSAPENLVSAIDEDDHEKIIDLSRPLNYSHLSTSEMTAVFNHPAMHKHGKTASRPIGVAAEEKPVGATSPGSPLTPQAPVPSRPTPVLTANVSGSADFPIARPPVQTPSAAPPRPDAVDIKARENDQAKAGALSTCKPPPVVNPVRSLEERKQAAGSPEATAIPNAPVPVAEPKPRPNAWLKPVLDQPSIRHDWFACLVYSKIAEFVRSSNPGRIGPVNCWSVALDEVEDISDPMFKGVFLSEKGGFGFLNQGHIARFNKGVVLLGTQETAIEGIGVSLVAAGFDIEGRTVFVVAEDYVGKFGMPEHLVRRELATLKEFGALLMTPAEVLDSPTPIDVIWTVPAAQEDPQDPKPIESRSVEESVT